MNAAARTLTQGNLFKGDFAGLVLARRSLFICLLWVAVISSALAVIYTKHLERTYISELEQINRNITQLEVEHGQLLLEKSMWAAPGRVRALAHRHLGMHFTKPYAVITISGS